MRVDEADHVTKSASVDLEVVLSIMVSAGLAGKVNLVLGLLRAETGGIFSLWFPVGSCSDMGLQLKLLERRVCRVHRGRPAFVCMTIGSTWLPAVNLLVDLERLSSNV